MNTRSRSNQSESGIGGSECPPTATTLHRIYEEPPRSPSTAVTTAVTTAEYGIPKGRVLDRSPVRTAMGPPASLSTPAPPSRRPASPTFSERTNRSHRSTASTSARLKRAEYEAEKELATLEEERIRIKKNLVKRRLEAEMSAIEAEADEGSTAGGNERVNEWMTRSHEELTKGRRRDPEVLPPATEARGEDGSRRRGIEQLADTLQKMMTARPSPRQTLELPPFSGSIMEWLPFKAAMDDSTLLHKFSATENLLRLRNSLRGEARETVLSQLYTAAHPDTIMKTLEMKYGRPEFIIDRAIDNLKRLPKVGNSSGELHEIAIRLQNIVHTMKSVDRRGYLQNPLLIRDVMEKLSPHLVSKWAEYAVDHEERITQTSEIMVLSEFLMTEADRVLRYTHTARKSAPGPLREERPIRKPAPREKVFSTIESTNEERTPSCFRCPSKSHQTPECPKLRELTLNERWQWAKEQRLCFKCMKKRHSRYNCRAKPCGVDGCRMQHHSMLHKTTETSKEEEDPGCTEPATPAAVMNVTSITAPSTVLLKTCKVKISGPRGELITDALLDEGSTVTLIEEGLARKIANQENRRTLNIKGINEDRQIASSTVEICIRGLHEKKSHCIKARTIKGLKLHQQKIPEGLDRYPHLKNLTTQVSTSQKPQILIGADNWHLIVSRQLRVGRKNEPAASWTKLGWVIHGSIPRNVILKDEAAVLHVIAQPSDIRLEQLVERHFNVDSLGITAKNRISASDQRAEQIFKNTVRRKGDKFEVGLTWKTDNPVLPDNYEQAFNRLKTLEKKMNKDPAFKKEYDAQVENLLEKDYAQECSGGEEENARWYLPHFAVVNMNKPGKVRMVFDAAAKTRGVSLNDCLLEGPDLLASLTKILFGFREKRIAVTADIEEMFLRIKIRPEDQTAQMFLWRDNPDVPPRRYKMTSMIFGASSSPYLAHSVRNKNAQEFQEQFPEAARAIQERHYMDDYLDSYETEEEATRVIKDIIAVHERASFNLRGWNSNNAAVLKSIPESKRSKNADVKLTHHVEKTLGLMWNPREDTLGFNTEIRRVPTEIMERRRVPTKRETLSAVMSVYDPLGLISQYTITGKILLQRLWNKRIDWDEELPEEEALIFHEWVAGLQDVAALHLPRCYNVQKAKDLQLHVFNDASEQAYATTAYWRITQEDGTVEIVHVMGKAKVAPLKILTIPRLELQAALIGARMANNILRDHTCKPSRVYYWTDSRTVLHWIRNDRKKYTPFVAHRLAEISELSHQDEWRWVSTYDNVADDGTRTRTSGVRTQDRWFTGPAFLRLPERDWPEETTDSPSQEETTCTIDTNVGYSHLPDIARFSAYRKLIRTTALVLLFIEKLRKKRKDLPIEMAHIREAERQWIRQSQKESFKEDIDQLNAGLPLQRRSNLSRFDPVLEDGIMKARGRIGSFKRSSHTNRPVILDGRHPYTRLLIKNQHEEALHANNERVVNELRQKYIITRLRPTVKKIARTCQQCKIRKASPQMPSRGDLPRERLSPGHRPFNHCGIDYFGPLLVTVGRRKEKRWCALFTCLTTRAIHLELVTSLSTDSAIMALRRMAARRGWPATIYSDNATNFRGADVELRSAYKSWIPELYSYGLQHDTQWRFIPPGAPHMGGAWERLVRSVKAALNITLRERAPKEEVLQTLLTEAEYCINARPLTHVSVDPADDEALTPNHFLIGTSTGLPLTGTCEEADRSTWRKAQALADQFWRRWIAEYLPDLIPRGQGTKASSQLAEGDLVVVVDKSLPRNTWPRGIIDKVHPGPDGIVRSADVRTNGGIFRRPTSRLAVLLRKEAAAELRRGETVADSSP